MFICEIKVYFFKKILNISIIIVLISYKHMFICSNYFKTKYLFVICNLKRKNKYKHYVYKCL